jgi:anti-sigma factor RsiW
MSCRVFRSRVVAFADGELPPDEAQFMAQHARSCAECAAELAAAERETALYTAALRPEAAPADLAESVLGALEGLHRLPEPAAPPVRYGVPVKWVLSTAAAAAVLLFGLLGGMGAALNSRRPPASAAAGWTVVPAYETLTAEEYRRRVEGGPVQAEGFAVSPTGGPVYSNSPARANEAPRAQPANPFRLVSSDGRPLQHAAPEFQVQEYREAGDAQAMNKALTRPQAVTSADQQRLNAPSAAAAEGPLSGPSASGAVTRTAREPAGVALPGMPADGRTASPVTVDSTDAQVVLTVGYEDEGDRYITVYDADFSADYVVRAPDTQGRKALIVLTFPFPNDCSTVSGSRLLVDEKSDDEHTAYSIAGIRWSCWFKPKETKTLSIAYKARGQGNYRYVLDKVNLTQRLRFLMRIDGLESGREIEIPPDSLPPGRPGSTVSGRWDYLWDYTRLLTTKDIAVNFPTRESPSVAAGRVMQTVGQYLFVARLAPIFLVVFLAALGLGGLWNRAHVLKVEELGLLGIAFLLFYPLFLFGAAYLGRDAALWGAVVIVSVLSALYLARSHGTALAGRAVLLEVILLGAFTYALFDRALTGLIFTGGATVLLAWFMLLHGRRAAELAQGSPARVARAEPPHPPDAPVEDGREA